MKTARWALLGVAIQHLLVSRGTGIFEASFLRDAKSVSRETEAGLAELELAKQLFHVKQLDLLSHLNCCFHMEHIAGRADMTGSSSNPRSFE